MKKYNKKMIDIIRKMQSLNYVKPEDIPDIDLYMDQITSYMDEHLSSSKRFDEDKILTKTMINNYSKNDLLPPSSRKKYSREHMTLLLFIYYYKSFLSIADIKKILDPVKNNFFDSEKKDMTDIYKDIYDLQISDIDEKIENILDSYKKSEDYYANISDEEERQTLANFAFVCSLSFDIYIKKFIIEKMIDDGLL